jgi:hypothetical protein
MSDAINPANGHGITAGIVDARNCTTLTITSEIDVGNASSVPVTLLVPCGGTWTATMNDGVSYALKVFSRSSAIGCQAGEGQLFIIKAGSGSNLANVCGTNAVLGYYRMEGFACNAAAGSIIGQAVCNFQYMQDESYVGNMTCTTNASTYRVTWIQNDCCNARFEGINSESNGIGVGQQLAVCQWDSNIAIHLHGASCVHPAQGAPAVRVDENGGCNNHYSDVYMEQITGQSTMAPPYVSVVLYSATPCADVFDNFTASGDVAFSTRPMFSLANGTHAVIRNAEQSNVSTTAVTDGNANGVNTTAPVSTTFNYSTEPFSLPTCTFANLGAVPAAGQGTKYCKDCTTAATCAGSGTGHLAVSNGTNWTCK